MSYRGRAAGTIGDVTPDEPLRIDVRAYYEAVSERSRLLEGYGMLERVRTQEVLLRHLPAAPAVVADIGGGAGVHAIWLAGRGYAVHLRDLAGRTWHRRRRTRRQRASGSRRPGSPSRALDLAAASVDVALLLGPLYHLQDAPDRMAALAEARRVLRPAARLGFHPRVHAHGGRSPRGGVRGRLRVSDGGLEGARARDSGPPVLEAAQRVEAADEVVGLSPHLLCVAR